MGQFTDNSDPTKGHKKMQTVLVPVLTGEENVEEFKEVIEGLPDSYTAELVNVSASSGVADILVTYTAKGATIHDVKRVLRKAGLEFVTKRPKTVKEDTEA